MQTKLNFTAVFEEAQGGYIAYIEEFPGVNTQGDTLEEAKTNLMEALEMVMQVRREQTEENLSGKRVIREPIKIVA